MAKGYQGPSFADLVNGFGASISPHARRRLVVILYVTGAAVMVVAAYGLAAEYLPLAGHDSFRDLVPALGEHRGPHWPLASFAIGVIGYTLLRAAYLLR